MIPQTLTPMTNSQSPVGTSVSPRPGAGYRETLLTWHAPTVPRHVVAFDEELNDLLIGARQPNLTYMLSYEDLAGRDKVWKAFGADPEWQKLRSTPGLTDPEIVSNISNSILRPLAFSPIR